MHARTLWAPSGVPVSVAPSWPLGIALTAWTVGDALLPDAVPGRSTAAYTIAAIATAAALAFTLALHEAAHAAVARRGGLSVRRITLSFVGGALELADTPLTPGVELRVALAGPIASGMLALAATLAHVPPPRRSSRPGTALTLLGHTHGSKWPPHASRPGAAGTLLGHAVRAR